MLRMTETRGHLLSHYTWDSGPAISTLPPSQCDNSPGMRRSFVPVMWPLSINMFYPVLINTYTRWPASEVCHTQLASCQQHFLGSGLLTIMPSSSDMHQTTISSQHFLGFCGPRGSWTKNFLWGDNSGWQRSGNCLPTFLTTASLPSFLSWSGWRHAFKDPDDIIFSCHHLDPWLMRTRCCNLLLDARWLCPVLLVTLGHN